MARCDRPGANAPVWERVPRWVYGLTAVMILLGACPWPGTAG
ncbi:hypothetical protein QNM99_11780 [Pseudomonas sp. PCH446]